MKERSGIATAILSLVGFLLIVGIVWIVIYYGGIQPIYNSIVGTWGTNIYDSNDIAFVLTVCAFWVFILTLGGLWYLWQQSQKRDLYGQ